MGNELPPSQPGDADQTMRDAPARLAQQQAEAQRKIDQSNRQAQKRKAKEEKK